MPTDHPLDPDHDDDRIADDGNPLADDNAD